MYGPQHWCQLSLLIAALCITNGQAQVHLVGELDPSVTTSYGDVWGFDDYAVLGTRLGEGVFIIDIADPTSPSVTSQYFPSRGSAPQDVKVHDGIGYFAMNSQGGVDIVDLSNPAEPTFLANVGSDGVHNVFVANSFLFTTSGSTRRINVYDVSDPSAPEFVYDLTTSGRTHDMTVVGERLYSANISNGTTDIFDLSQMTTITEPVLLGSFESGASTHSNWVTDDGSILASAEERRRGRVSLFDISDPENVTQLVSFRSTDFLDGSPANHIPHNPVIVGNTLYVSWYTLGVVMFDISDPSHPVQVGRYDTQNNWGVYPFLGPETVLLSDIANGLKIVDVSSVLDGTAGDFNGDDHWDCLDIDLLVASIASGSTNRDLDMNGDGFLSDTDVAKWLATASSKNLAPGESYRVGDANLDGVLDDADFSIWNQNKFTELASYCAGDFNADGSIDGADFLIWNTNRFEVPPVGAATAVPEPGLLWSLLLLFIGFYRSADRRA